MHILVNVYQLVDSLTVSQHISLTALVFASSWEIYEVHIPQGELKGSLGGSSHKILLANFK